MKKLLTLAIAAMALAAFCGVSYAAIGWAGNIWPVHETAVTDADPVNVYIQVWKDGVTPGEGQGPGISSELFYGPLGGPYDSVEMFYNSDVGNNDEYTAAIPVSALSGQSELWFYCEVFDSTDASTYTGAQDQNGNDPPFKLNITNVLGQDVTVYFFLCFPPEGHPDYDPDPGEVCITGDHPELTNWGSGVPMYRPCPAYSPQFYEVSVTFAAGSNPFVQYKYRNHGCNDWEWVGNRTVEIDDSNPVFLVPWVDHWNNYDGEDCPICGVGVESSTWGNIKSMYR